MKKSQFNGKFGFILFAFMLCNHHAHALPKFEHKKIPPPKKLAQEADEEMVKAVLKLELYNEEPGLKRLFWYVPFHPLGGVYLESREPMPQYEDQSDPDDEDPMEDDKLPQ